MKEKEFKLLITVCLVLQIVIMTLLLFPREQHNYKVVVIQNNNLNANKPVTTWRETENKEEKKVSQPNWKWEYPILDASESFTVDNLPAKKQDKIVADKL